MSKAILVLGEMPEVCIECPLYAAEYDLCNYMLQEIEWCDEKPEWCPLKAMPEKNPITGLMINDAVTFGWNGCIDYILGVREDE